jgi:hypothetical protein
VSRAPGVGVDDLACFGIVTRDQAQFKSLISDLIDVIEGDLPNAGPDCDTCNYLIKRLALESN